MSGSEGESCNRKVVVEFFVEPILQVGFRGFTVERLQGLVQLFARGVLGRSFLLPGSESLLDGLQTSSRRDGRWSRGWTRNW